jgi:glyoxylase-like metal-dependent hydrolase (beta-lactamase superfamily II)
LRAASLLLAIVACTPAPAMVVPRNAAGIAVGTVALGLSNVHVMLGEHPVLVDTGSPGELADLEAGLGKLGIRLADVRCAVVTHVHADHAGNARALQLRGIKIIAGSGDLMRAVNGDHGTLHPTSFFAHYILKPLIPHRFAAFWPDVRVRDRYDLHDCGVDAEVIAMPGHTAGSLVVIAGGGKLAFVGDLFRGGALAGYVHRGEPKEHFYQDDLAAVHRHIRELLARGVEIFLLGHGGPAKRADVERVFGR